MTASKLHAPRQVPPPAGKPTTSTYGRFIPREELQGFASWRPGSFGDGPALSPTGAPPEPDAAATPEQQQAEVHAARQSGYQDGYRDGLVALESFKQTYAQQVSAQVGSLIAGFDTALAGLEQQMAASLARVATQMARQVVRDEIRSRPDLVARVAQEAVNAVLMSARHIAVRVHPDDQALVAHGAAEALAARGARLLPDPGLARGGVMVDSDVGSVDARIATRWAQASQMLGAEVPWSSADDEPTPGAAG